MSSTSPTLAAITDAEEAEIQAGIACDPDNPEWDRGLTSRPRCRFVRPSRTSSPSGPTRRAAIEAGTAIGLGLTLDRDVVERFMATGPGLTRRMSDDLRRASEDLA